MRPESTRRGSTSSLKDALQAYLRTSGLDAQLRDAAVFRAWDQALGPVQARRARPVRFHEGELVVEVDSAALLAQLKGFTGEAHRLSANARLTSAPIRRVTFKTRR